MMRTVVCFVLLAVVSLPAAADDRGVKVTSNQRGAREQKVALVIGNGAYASSPLRNPTHDARAMAVTLRELGFVVDERTDLGRDTMLRAADAFGKRLKDGGVGLFYYAGHGMQVNGENYLIAVDAKIESEEDVKYNAIDANYILDKMKAARNVMNIVILDACRNNPFARSFRSSVQGLATMNAPRGTIVAYATSPGAVASDGSGRNSVYTEELTQIMKQGGLKIEEAFKLVRAKVLARTQEKQVPWESSSLVGDFYFNRLASPIPAVPVPVAKAEGPDPDSSSVDEDGSSGKTPTKKKKKKKKKNSSAATAGGEPFPSRRDDKEGSAPGPASQDDGGAAKRVKMVKMTMAEFDERKKRIQEAEAARYDLSDAQTIRDLTTGLTWQRETDGVLRTWEAAIAFCEDLRLGSLSDWRLPEMNEMESVRKGLVFLNADVLFKNKRDGCYWSSTSEMLSPASAGCYHAFYTNPAVDREKAEAHYVRCVTGKY